MVQTPVLITIAMIPLIIWRMYARVRRHIGRQTSVLWRHWASAIVFPLVLAVIGFSAGSDLHAQAALAAGAVAGIALAIWGLKLTRFEATPEGFFYTPNAHIGIALSVLLIGRLLYRFVMMAITDTAAPPPQTLTQSPLTLLILGMLMAYYPAYAIGILKWRLRKSPAT